MIIIYTIIHRLYYTFEQSIYAVSKTSVRIFIFILVIAIFSSIARIITTFIWYYSNNSDYQGIFFWLTAIFIAIVYFFGVIGSIFVSILFVYKLNTMNIPENNHSDTTFISIIIKTTILTVISSLSTLLFVIISGWFFIVTLYDENENVHNIWKYCLTLDVMTNFCCIILTNNFADKYYQNLCGCLDIKCKKYFTKSIINKNKIIVISPSKSPEISSNKAIQSETDNYPL